MPKTAFYVSGKLPQETLFLLLTFIVIFIVMILSPDVTTALLIIGLLVGVAVYLRNQHEKLTYRDSGVLPGSPEFPSGAAVTPAPFAPSGAPVTPAPFAPSGAPSGSPSGAPYRGAIDVDGETDMYALEYDEFGEYGHEDSPYSAAMSAPYGNPFDLDSMGSPAAARADFDDEANNDEMDGDERITYQQRSRNDPTRVTAGTMNRHKMLDPYLRGEVEEEADSPWWGRHEV